VIVQHCLAMTPQREQVSTRIHHTAVLGEELGDGDMKENHVWVCWRLMQSTNTDTGAGDRKRFADQSRNPNTDRRSWNFGKALSHSCAFPVSRVPAGAVGLNMGYESLPLHLVIVIQELRESKLDPHYAFCTSPLIAVAAGPSGSTR